MIKPEILWKGEIRESGITVNIIPEAESNRRKDPELESEFCPKEWQSRLLEAQEKGQELYNGTSYRMESFDFEDGRLALTVSPIEFSKRWTLKRSPRLEQLGEEYYSHGLSTAGFVQTSDGKYIFTQKSGKSASVLKIDIIGGVLEKIEPASGVGLFNNNRKELKEEINVDPTMINDMRVIGLVRSHTTDIVIVTFTKLNITLEQLHGVFDQREDFELEGIEVVEADDLEGFLIQQGGYKPFLFELL